MNTYTKGPWRIGFSDSSGPTYITTLEEKDSGMGGKLPDCVVSGCEDDYGIPQGVLKPEDARLIVKAPDMLEMLIKLHAPMAHVEQWTLEMAARKGSTIPALGKYNATTVLALRRLILEAGGEL